MNQPPVTIQRTLIVACGPHAAAVSELFQQKLVTRQGPTAAIAFCHFTEDHQQFNETVVAALQHISPTTLAATLHKQGWLLAEFQEISLFLLLDAAENSQATARHELADTAVGPVAGHPALLGELTQQIAATVRQYLGLDTNQRLIWLVSDPLRPYFDTLTEIPFCQNSLILSPLNEDGLRLADLTQWHEITAELLWLLTTTAVPALLEREAALSTSAQATTVGLSRYQWSPTMVHDIFLQRWLMAILAHWLAPHAAWGPTAVNEVIVAEQALMWLQKHGLGAEALAQLSMSCLNRWQPPAYALEQWAASWPWELPSFYFALQAADSHDDTQQKQVYLAVEQQLDEPLSTAAETLIVYLQKQLDTQPVASITRNGRWLQVIRHTLTKLYEQTAAQKIDQQQLQSALADERGGIEAQFRTHLQHWPATEWSGWVRRLWRPWQWPRLIWRYWQLRQLGQRLCPLLARQAEQRRQRLITTTVGHSLLELEKIAGYLQSNVEEMGDMLRALQRKVAADRYEDSDQFPGHTPVLDRLYGQIIQNERQEAELAAQAVGGLGQQLRALDDAILELLRQAGRERLAAIWQLTAVDILLTLCPTSEAQRQWWAGFWQEATPLWRFSEAQLSDSARAASTTTAIVCGAGVSQLAAALPETISQSVHWLDTPDQERIILLRLRQGLPVTSLDWFNL